MKIYAKILFIKMIKAKKPFEMDIMSVDREGQAYASCGIIGDGEGTVTLIYYTKMQDADPLEYEQKIFSIKKDKLALSKELALISDKGYLEICATPGASCEEDGIFREDIIC